MVGENLPVIVVLVGGAAAIPFLARRLSVPSAIMEILFGIAVFSTVLSRKPEWFSFFKEIGLIYLMFVAGMELDLRGLIRRRGFAGHLLTVALGFAVTPLAFVWLGYPFYLGITVSVLSAGVIIPVLKESGLMRTGVGRGAVELALTGEFVSILVLTGVDIYHSHGGLTLAAALSAVKLVLLAGAAALFLKLLYLVAWWNPERVAKVMESEDPVEEGIRAVIFIAFTGALFAFAAGVEPILGSFMAGVIFSLVFKSKGRFEDKINAVGFGFFIPFFFIGVGADFDTGLLGSAGDVAFALFLGLMVLASNVYPVLFSLPGRKGLAGAAATSLLLSAPLSMMIVAGTIGIRAGLLTDRMYASVVLAAIITGIVCPSLARPLGKRILEAEEAKKPEAAAPS
ncbi:MAG: monovalent cation:proton antiporter-2 (CPA2) family protein [Thermodesulfovibrionales bacterium]